MSREVLPFSDPATGESHADKLDYFIRHIPWKGAKTPFGRATGYIYVISAKTFDLKNRFYKIGFTRRDPRRRMADLQTGCPYPLRLMTFFPGCQRMEEHLHDTLSVWRASGEWFRATDECYRNLYAEMVWILD